MDQNLLFYLILIIGLLVYRWRAWKMVCWYFGKDITCELLGIRTLVHVHMNLSIKDHYISADNVRYVPSTVTKYLDTATVKLGTKFYKNTLPADMLFTEEDLSTSDEQV